MYASEYMYYADSIIDRSPYLVIVNFWGESSKIEE